MKFTQIVEAETIEEFKQGVQQLHSLVCLSVPGNETGNAQLTGAGAPDCGVGAGKGKSKKSGKKAEESEVVDVISPSKLKEEAAAAADPFATSEADIEVEEDADPFATESAEAAEEPEEKKIEFKDVNEAFKELVALSNMDKAREVCKEFKAGTISAIKEAEYPKVMTRVQAEIKKLKK